MENQEEDHNSNNELPILGLQRPTTVRNILGTQWLHTLSPISFNTMPMFMGFFYSETSDSRVSFFNPSVAAADDQMTVVNGGFEVPLYSPLVLDTCNGLVLFGVMNFWYILYNPIADQFFPLPNLIRSYIDVGTKVHGLAFDHSTTPPCLEVVVIIIRTNSSVFEVESFSSLTSEWRDTPNVFDAHVLFEEGVEVDYRLHGPSTFLRGKLHWLSDGYSPHIFAYDVRDRVFSVVPPPVFDGNDWAANYTYNYLGKLRNRLVFVQFLYFPKYGDIFNLTIWTLENYNERRWILEYRVDRVDIPYEYGRVPYWIVCGLDTRTLYLFYGTNLYSFDIPLRLFRHIHQFRRSFLVNDLFLSYYMPYQYELPRSPPSLSPHSYFSYLFGQPTIGSEALKEILELFRAGDGLWQRVGTILIIREINLDSFRGQSFLHSADVFNDPPDYIIRISNTEGRGRQDGSSSSSSGGGN